MERADQRRIQVVPKEIKEKVKRQGGDPHKTNMVEDVGAAGATGTEQGNRPGSLE